MPNCPTIALLTDFSLRDGYIGVMKSVIYAICSTINIVDRSHHLSPKSVPEATVVLWNSNRFFPKNTIFARVVAPRVGSEGAIIAVKTQHYTFIAPDNGLLDWILAARPNASISKVTNTAYFNPIVSQTFHGRDIFAPIAAHLANGIAIQEVGVSYKVAFPKKILFITIETEGKYEGRMIYIDKFGNLITNFLFLVKKNYVPSLIIKDKELHSIATSYASVEKQKPVVLIR